ncbi:MAG TPA: helix-turn-helix transcriptional regulator [Armatimonadota bacterium]|nr:helix-turn-helix transcriptional regulator [Armatimonadota bacterium]
MAEEHGRAVVEILRQALERSGKTRARIAEIIGVTPQSVGRWISGAAPVPLRRAEELAVLLEIEPSTRRLLLYHVTLDRADEDVREIVREARGAAGPVRPEDLGVPDWHKRLVFTLAPAEALTKLYEEYVPIEGEFDPEFGIISSAERLSDDEADRQYLVFGRVPKGSVAVVLSVEAAGFPARTMIIFGPECPLPPAGMGLLAIAGQPQEVIGHFERSTNGIYLFVKSERMHFPKSVIKSFRPFLALA